jgi:hypothetical protein
MTNSYQYSIKVNEALESYGARTHGSLARRVERLKRFTDLKNKMYADEIMVEHARMVANQEREDRVRNRVRAAPVFLRRNLRSHSYNLRSRSGSESGLNLLCHAIQNGFVMTNRG